MKKSLFYIFILIIVTACGNSYEEQKRLSKAERARLLSEDSAALKIAVMPTLDCLPVFVAKEHVMYDTTKVDLRLKYFTAQMDCDTAVIGKSVEGIVSDLVRTERMRQKGTALSYISSTNAYWQLITNYKARIKKVDQLGDKMVAMTRFSATDFLTDRVLDGVKTSSIVFRIQVNDVNIRLAMLLNNEMDAMWLTEPYATVARRHGNYVLADSRDMKLNLGVIAFRTDAMSNTKRNAQIIEFTKAYDKACDSLNHYGIKKYFDIVRKYYKIGEKDITAMPKIKFTHITPPKHNDINTANRKK